MVEKPTYEELEQLTGELDHKKFKTPTQSTNNNTEREDLCEIDIQDLIQHLDLGSIINKDEIQSIMEDFNALTHMATAILDINGNVIEATGWQDICTRFHRINPQTARNCTESDLFLARNLKPGEFVDYKCKNGLWDVVTPIHIGATHIGNIYTGQFFYDDDPVDESVFVKQAQSFGFDTHAYIDALRRVPRFSREQVNDLMRFMVKFASYISTISLANIRLEKEIKERKKVQDALRTSEAEFRTLFDSSPAGVAMLKNRVVMKMNAMLYTITGYTESELVGRSSRILYNTEEEFNQVGQDLYGNEEKECLAGVEFKIRRKDGRMVDVLIITKQVDPDDPSQGVVATLLDISQRKRAEEERERLEEQLRQTHKIESVGRLAGGVAHDFNNMLGVIIGHTEIAMDRVNPAEPIYGNLEEIRKAAQRSADLTRQLLTFARKQTVSPRILDLNNTVSAMLDMLRRLVGEDIDLEWSPGRDIHAVRIDPVQVDQILVNLVINTRDAIGGPGKVSIETGNVVFNEEDCSQYADLVPDTYTLLAVSDSGRGMDKEELEHIFEPFFTTKEQGKGTGLGLATVYGIVKQNNGFIHVFSEPGEGTTFRIYLPSILTLPEKESIQQESVHRGGSETILLVEDEEAIRNLTTAILKRLGYNVISAQTPSQALELVESYTGEIHMLLTDVVMPEMNGSQLNDRLKDLRPGIKTLFMSGYTSNIIAHHGVLDDRVKFIQKPFSVHKLDNMVREVLDH